MFWIIPASAAWWLKLVIPPQVQERYSENSTLLNCEQAACHFLPFLFVHLFQQSPFYAYTLLLMLPQRLKVIRKRYKAAQKWSKTGKRQHNRCCDLHPCCCQVLGQKKSHPRQTLSNSLYDRDHCFIMSKKSKNRRNFVTIFHLNYFCSGYHVAPTDLSRCLWLDQLQVTRSNQALTGDPPLHWWSSSAHAAAGA